MSRRNHLDGVEITGTLKFSKPKISITLVKEHIFKKINLNLHNFLKISNMPIEATLDDGSMSSLIDFTSH